MLGFQILCLCLSVICISVSVLLLNRLKKFAKAIFSLSDSLSSLGSDVPFLSVNSASDFDSDCGFFDKFSSFRK